MRFEQALSILGVSLANPFTLETVNQNYEAKRSSPDKSNELDDAYRLITSILDLDKLSDLKNKQLSTIIKAYEDSSEDAKNWVESTVAANTSTCVSSETIEEHLRDASRAVIAEASDQRIPFNLRFQVLAATVQFATYPALCESKYQNVLEKCQQNHHDELSSKMDDLLKLGNDPESESEDDPLENESGSESQNSDDSADSADSGSDEEDENNESDFEFELPCEPERAPLRFHTNWDNKHIHPTIFQTALTVLNCDAVTPLSLLSIKREYRKLAIRSHTDKQQGNAGPETIQSLNAANGWIENLFNSTSLTKNAQAILTLYTSSNESNKTKIFQLVSNQANNAFTSKKFGSSLDQQFCAIVEYIESSRIIDEEKKLNLILSVIVPLYQLFDEVNEAVIQESHEMILKTLRGDVDSQQLRELRLTTGIIGGFNKLTQHRNSL